MAVVITCYRLMIGRTSCTARDPARRPSPRWVWDPCYVSVGFLAIGQGFPGKGTLCCSSRYCLSGSRGGGRRNRLYLCGGGRWKWRKQRGSKSELFLLKGIFRDHSRDNALNFHKIRDFCILVMVLDV